MRSGASYAFRQVVDFILRKKSPALIVMKIGLSLITIGCIGGLLFSFSFQSAEFSIRFDWFPEGNTPLLLSQCAFVMGAFLTLAGFVWAIRIYQHERKDTDRKMIIAIEQRGLLPDPNSPLWQSVQSFSKGQVQELLVDHTPYMKDGIVTDPESALAEVQTIRHDIQRIASGGNRPDVSIFYGGVSPVPLTFLAGYLCDDENHITIIDWHRMSRSWQLIEDNDNGLVATVPSLEGIPRDTKEVAVLVEISYRIDERAVEEAVGDIPQIRCSLDIPKPDCHWSQEMQINVAQSFLQTMGMVESLNVQKVHLFIAAPNSLVFRLGSTYDRNLFPNAVIYQYQKDATPKHPWAVELPEQGHNNARIVWS